MKRKLVSDLLLLLFAFTLLSACSGQGAQPAGSVGEGGDKETEQPEAKPADDKPFAGVVLRTISGPDETGYWGKLNKEFEDKTGIKIEVDTVPYGQQQQKLVNSFLSGGSTYDLFVMDVIDLPQYVEAGWVEPVDQWIQEEWKTDLLPFAQSAVVYKDKWYGLPWASEWKSFVYNKEMLKKAGYDRPPANWDDFIKVSKELQDKGIVKYASTWSWLQGEALICDFVAIAASKGAVFFDDSGQPKFNDEKSVEALQMMVDMLHKYKIVDPASLTFSESNVSNAMQAGDIAFELSWGIPQVGLNDEKQSKVVGQTEVARMPYSVKAATISGPMAYSISSGSKNKEAAWEYIKFLAGPDGAKRAAVENGVFPGWKSVIGSTEVKAAIPGLEELLEQGETAVNRPQVPWYHEWSSMMQVELQNALTQKKSPKQALDDAMDKTLKLMKENE